MQDSATKDVFGIPALCVEQLGPMLKLQVESFKIVHGVKIPWPHNIVNCGIDEVVECQEEEMEPKVVKNWSSLSIAEQRFVVKACWGNENGYSVSAQEGKELHDCDLVAIFEYLQWQYMQTEVKFVRSAIVKIALHFPTSDEGMMCLQSIKDVMMMARFVVLPVHCDSPRHWTFLALEMEVENTSDRIVDVKYYDWLKGERKSAALAQRLLTNITLDAEHPEAQPMKLPNHCNWYRQRWLSNDCGLAGWQAMENCFKICRKEGPCGVLPEPQLWRKTLKTWLEKLVDVQSKWQMEEAEAKKPKHPICIPGVKKVGAEAIPLKLAIKDFFGAGCHSCRWTTTGDGCCYCNPGKHDKLRAEKEIRARAMAENLKKALEALKIVGLLPEVPAPKDPAGADQGGGGSVGLYDGGLRT